MLEYVTGESKDWLGNTAPEDGAMVVGASYTLAVGSTYRDEGTGEYEFAWELSRTKWPDEMRVITSSDEPVRLRATGYGGAPIPMTVKAWAGVLDHAAHQCAVAASVQIQREAAKSRKRFELAWPTRAHWPEPDYDGYSPAEQSFESWRLTRERAEWCAAAALFLADADRAEAEDSWG